MNLSVIIEKKPGHTMPMALLEHVNKLRGTVSGFAVRHSDKGKPEIDFEFAKTVQAAEAYNKIQEAAKDNTAFFFFSDKKGKFDDANDIQPFVLTNGDDAMLAVFVEGDFSKYSDPEGKRSDEGNLWASYLEPLLADMAGESKDIEAFYAKLRKKTFHDTLINASNHRCSFAFLPLTGEPILFGNNQLGKEYEWGNISDNLDFGVEKEKHVAGKIADAVSGAVASTKRRFFSDASASPAPQAPPPAAPTAPDTKHVAPAVPTPPVEPPKTDTAIEAGSVWLAPPEGCENSVRNLWYRTFNNNELPKDHSKRPKVMVKPHLVEFAKRPVKTSNDLKLLLKEMKDGTTVIASPKDMRTQEVAKVGETTVKEVVNNDKPQNVADYIPSMDGDTLTETMGLALKFNQSDILKRPTLLDLQKIEEGWAKFSVAVGIPLGDTMYWTPDQLMQLNKKALVQLLNEYKSVFRTTDGFKQLCSQELVARRTAEEEKHKLAKAELQPEPQKIAAAGGGKRRFFS